jgi:hypothetical protein
MRQGRPNGDPVDWFVVGPAAQKGYLSLYVSAVEDGQYFVRRYGKRLRRVQLGSANVTVRRLADLDVAVVTEMATRARDLVLGGRSEDAGQRTEPWDRAVTAPRTTRA